MTKEKITSIIIDALKKVVNEPGYLPLHEQSQLFSNQCLSYGEESLPHHRYYCLFHEQSLTHRLALYIENSGCFNGYMVDCEYNRHGCIDKTGPEGEIFRPDIIVHVRGNDKNNLIMIEAKKESESKTNIKSDIEKCKINAGFLDYKFGFMVIFPKPISNHSQKYDLNNCITCIYSKL